MRTNLFSVFDPCRRFFDLSLNWFAFLAIFIFIHPIYYIVPGRVSYLYESLCSVLTKELNRIIKNRIHYFSSVFVCVFLIIISINLLGLLPYIFTPRRHIRISIRLALIIWLSAIVLGWVMNTKHILSHMLPIGSPGLLIPFMVLIERVSLLIRPLTLSIRLSANIIAGHLLLVLVGDAVMNLSLSIFVAQSVLALLEVGVAFIQAYVFAMLVTLYVSEV